MAALDGTLILKLDESDRSNKKIAAPGRLAPVKVPFVCINYLRTAQTILHLASCFRSDDKIQFLFLFYF